VWLPNQTMPVFAVNGWVVLFSFVIERSVVNS